jgi:hypothetical protein
MNTPDLKPPAAVLAASDALEKVRDAIARQRESNAATLSQIASAEADHVRQSSDAALDGTPPPKVSSALKSLRETSETSAAVLADLLVREVAAKGAHQDAVTTWGWEIVREQVAADAKAGREALDEFATAARKLVHALGGHGIGLGEELLEAMPQPLRVARLERLAVFNGIFSSVGRRNPASEIGEQFLIEAGCPRFEDARRLAQTPADVSK